MNLISSPTRPLRVLLLATAIATLLSCDRQGSDPTQATLSDDNPAAPVAVISPSGDATTNFGDAVATSRPNGDGISTTLRDPSGNLLATLLWTKSAATLALDVPGASHLEGGEIEGNLTTTGCNYGVYFYWKNVQAALVQKARGDAISAPGCDYFPDFLETPCIRACCDAHDACWDQHDCSGWSWLGLDGWECTKCNLKVVACMAKCVFKAIFVPN